MADGQQAVWISEAEVVAMMDMGEAIAALERGLLLEALGAAQNMVKTHTEWNGATLHAVGATFPSSGICGTKTWAHTAAGATPLLILFDTETGALKAIIEAFALGQMRTAAASGVATRWLAASGANDFAMIGTGKQALAQVAAVAAVRPLRRIRVHGRDELRRAQFAALVRAQFEIEVIACPTVQDAVEGASIITVATRATEPILTAAMVQTGAHINSIGAIVPTRAEVAQDVLARSTQIVTDSVPQARKLSREMTEFFSANEAGWGTVQPLAQVVAGKKLRQGSDDISLFKALGVGISDVALGMELYRRAIEQNRGYEFAQPKRIAPRLSAVVN